ncbi:spermidine/putrescine ABC transporter ATP-binding protein [Serinibacter arcticus]|uniref:Spermidine/putrescine ABC transporter ATP-binding protein n=1 Tax=Serinibacter arcticus TaxID=1655435 RepID=A0A2U1ZSK8_9MICO|nr:ABC transporter ATP-binding protein [Serinibacter arcticus]PWD49969.1 spermidine/putrescine ABC transporter ATP-binding protein [Serinibacter arcticus]
MPSPALVIEDLTVAYSGRTVVDHLSLVAEAGGITAVLGPNGAGKTTTIECAEGLRRPDSGTITVLGDAAGSDRARSRVGVMLQDGGLPMARRVREVLALAAAMHASPLPVADLLARLGLDVVATTPVRRLSGGQRQRLALAVAVIGRPELVFLDEPSAGLDPHARQDVWELVRELRSDGVGIVLTTHLIEEADALADQVHVLVDGRLVESGTPADLIARHAGSDSQRLRLARPLSEGEAIELRTAVTAVGHDVTLDADGADLLVRGPATPALTLAIAEWCDRSDVLLRSLQVGDGTLEHAYLTITAAPR